MWFLLALFAAGATATGDVLFSGKTLKGLPALTRAWASITAAIPFLLVALFFAGIPQIKPEFWWLVAIEAVLMCAASLLYMRALSLGPLSQTQPILALTTVFLAITNPIMTNDTMTTLGVVGVILVGVGIYATQHPGRDPVTGKIGGFLSPFVEMWRQPGVMSKLGVAVIYSVTSNIDRLAMEAASGPFYLASYAILVSILFGVIFFVRRIVRGKPEAATSPLPIGKLILAGFIHAVAILFHVTALLFAPVPYVIAVKRFSILLTSVWDYFVRKGRAVHWYRLLGTMLVVGGVILIILFGK